MKKKKSYASPVIDPELAEGHIAVPNSFLTDFLAGLLKNLGKTDPKKAADILVVLIKLLFPLLPANLQTFLKELVAGLPVSA